MGEWHIGGTARLDAERHADNARVHVIEAGRFGVESDQRRRAQSRQPAFEIRALEHGFIALARRLRRGRRRGLGRSILLELAQPGLELEVAEQVHQARRVGLATGELGAGPWQFEVIDDGDQPTRQRNLFEGAAQIRADRAGHRVGLAQDFIQAAVFREPFHGRFRPDFRHAGHIVHAVADERQVVDDPVRRDAELGLDAFDVEHRIVHRVDQRNRRLHELCEILVAGGDHDVPAVAGRPARQRADDIVGLGAILHQARHAEGVDDVEQRRDLRGQVVGHRRPVGLVVRKPRVAMRLAARIEHHRERLRRILALQFFQHRDHTVDRTRRLPFRVGKPRQGVECAVQVGRAVDQHESGFVHGRSGDWADARREGPCFARPPRGGSACALMLC